MMDNARSLRITAAAGTKLAGANQINPCQCVIYHRTLQPHGAFIAWQLAAIALRRTRNMAGSCFRLLSNIPHCWLKKAWALFQSQCG
jgi:hypothetical protein